MPAADAWRGYGRAMDPAPEVRRLETRHGAAAVRLHVATEAVGTLALGHGAGGGIDAPDLLAVTLAAHAAGWTVALVEQPYRTAGRKAPPRAAVLDEAGTDVLAELAPAGVGRPPLVTGGRSAGARVACRTARTTGADGVLCLAFPTRPPGRPDAPSRVPELDGAGVPVLVVQGATDPYGRPPDASGRVVVTVRGDHSLRQDTAAVVTAVTAWLGALGSARPAPRA